MEEIKADMVEDTRGLACPMPVINTKKAISKLDTGQTLAVLATDFGSKSDIPVLVKRLGHELVEVKQKGDVFTFFIRKK